MNSKNVKWFYLVLLSLVWGSSFILIKKGLVGLSAIQLGSLRMVFASVFLLIFGFKSLPSIPIHKWKFLIITAFFGSFLPSFLFAIAETQIDSSISSVLNSLTPVSTLLLGYFIFKIDTQRRQFFGVFIGLIGSLVLIFAGANLHPTQNYLYAFFIIFATICYALNVNLIKKYLSDVSPIAISAGNATVLLIPSLIVLFSTNFLNKIHFQETQHSVFFILILGIVGTGIANILFFKLIQIASPVFATSVTYLIPIVAIVWGIFDDEILNFYQIIAAFIILFGVYLSSKK